MSKEKKQKSMAEIIDDVLKSGYKQVYLIETLLKFYYNFSKDSKMDETDTQMIVHIKEGINTYTRQIIQKLIELREIQSNIILKFQALKKGEIQLNETTKEEIRKLSFISQTLHKTINARFSSAKDSIKTIRDKSRVKGELYNILSSTNTLSIEKELDLYIKNLSIITIPKEMLIGMIIEFKYETLYLRFMIQDKRTEQKATIQSEVIDLIHLNEDNTIEPYTGKYYQGIPLKIIQTALKSRILLVRRETQKWLSLNKEKLIDEIGETRIRSALTIYGVFTNQEIERMLKSLMQTGSIDILRIITITEKRVTKMINQGLSMPKLKEIFYDISNEEKKEKMKGFDNIPSIIRMINQSSLTSNEKINALNLVSQRIIQPLINYLIKSGYIKAEEELSKVQWSGWLLNMIKDINQSIAKYQAKLMNKGDKVIYDDFAKQPPKPNIQQRLRRDA